jgi:hypothetical protein
MKMKKLLTFLTICVLMCACSGSKNYLERGDVDRSLQDAIKRLRKKPDDEKALEAIPTLYKTIKKKHLDQIEALSKSSSENRWQNLINEYDYLQNAYDVIINSTEAYKLITPESYAVPLYTMKDSAADYFYQKGLSYLKKRSRENAQLAYHQFNKAQNFVSGYKDVNDKKREAIEAGTVDIVIKRVQDNSIFNLRGFSYFGNRYSDEYFQQNLTHDLSGDKNIPARFYSEQEARSNDVEADWIIDLNLTRLDMPVPTASSFQRNVSKSIQIGTDTTGAAVYQTANATLLTTRTNYKAIADLEMKLKDLDENRNSLQRIFHEEYSWYTDRVSFQGDRRALSNQDWDLINKYEDRQPKKEEILIQLYKQIYPNLLSQIRKSVAW